MTRPSRHSPTDRNDRGITVLEVVMALALVSLVIGSVYGVFVLAVKRAERAQARSEIQQNVRVTIDAIAKELRETSQSPVGVRLYNCPGTTCTIGFVTARNSGGSFVLEPDPTVPTYSQPSWQGVVYIYPDAAAIKRHVDYSSTAPGSVPVTFPPTDQILLGNLQEVEFQRNGSTIRVRLVAVNRSETTSIETDIEPENL